MKRSVILLFLLLSTLQNCEQLYTKDDCKKDKEAQIARACFLGRPNFDGSGPTISEEFCLVSLLQYSNCSN